MATDLRRYVHCISYIDQRLMMMACSKDGTEDDRPFYYVVDRMNDVRFLLDAAGAIVESYSSDPYGKPLIRECAGRGDMTGDSELGAKDENWFAKAYNCDIFDPRGDIDGDGDVDREDETLYYEKEAIWDGSGPSPVRMARSLVGNPYMFQGRPNFVFATNLEDEHPELTLNDHRNRFADPMTGRWLTRDPAGYISGFNLFEALHSSPLNRVDPIGLDPCFDQCMKAHYNNPINQAIRAELIRADQTDRVTEMGRRFEEHCSDVYCSQFLGILL